MNGTYGDKAKDAARAVIEDSSSNFIKAGLILRKLCFNSPSDAGNFSLRFESSPPRFVFTKSAQHLLYYNAPLSFIGSQLSVIEIATEIQSRWKELDG